MATYSPPPFGHAPQRVVSLVPSITESLFEFGLGARLVGVTDYCRYPEAATRLPKVGGTKNPDLAAIKKLLPELIIVNQEENPRSVAEALEAAGFRVWVTFPRTVRGAIDVLWDMVRLFDIPQQGQTLSVLEMTYEWASLAAENTPPIRAFCPIWREPWMTFNHDTYIHDLLRICGAENVCADWERRYPLAADLGAAPEAEPPAERDTRYPRLTLDELNDHPPELILLPSEPYAFTDADRAAFEPYAHWPAAQNNRIVCVDGSLLTWHGTRLARALADLPALIQNLAAHTSEG
jgi:ABC-type hemin transport system substrate-binding protein